MSQENVRVYPAILLKPEDNYDAVFDRLHAEGWSVNSSEYMQANTLEEAVMLQAESFPCLEFQPIQLPNPTDRFKWISAGKWVAFHRTPRPKPSLTPQEIEQVHDYFAMNLQDEGLDPTSHEEDFKKALDPQKNWSENLAVMDNLIERLKPTKPAEAQPTMPCAVYVEGGTDPANSHEPQYFVTLLPKGMTFPEDFFIGRGIMDTPQLEEYLKSQEDYYDEVESQGMMDDEYREEMVKKLPAPFNKLEAYVKLTWTYPEAAEFDDAGQIIWGFYHTNFTQQELEAKTVDELKTIAGIKGASTGGNKPEIIQSILYKQPQPLSSPPLEKIYFIDRDVAAKLLQKSEWWTATPSPEVPVKTPYPTLPDLMKKGFRYVISIRPPNWEGYKYGLWYDKLYGDSQGGATEVKTKQELLDHIKRIFNEWNQFDSILGRQPDKPTIENVFFESFTPDITKMELFGSKRLDAFF